MTGTIRRARVGEIGAWLLIAIAAVIVGAGLLLALVAGTTRGGPFYFAFYVGLAAPPLIAGVLALSRPSPATYLFAALLAGGVGGFCLWGVLFGAGSAAMEPAVRLAVLLVASAGLVSALCLVVALLKSRGEPLG